MAECFHFALQRRTVFALDLKDYCEYFVHESEPHIVLMNNVVRNGKKRRGKSGNGTYFERT